MTVVPYTSVPANAPQWFSQAFNATGHSAAQAPDGWHVDDANAFLKYYATFDGSADQLAWTKSNSFSGGLLDQLEKGYTDKYPDGFDYTGPDSVTRTFQIDPQSQFNIDVMANVALGAMVNGEPWDAKSYFIAADNSHMALPTAKDMRTFALAVRSYVAGLILKNRAVKDEIVAATTSAQVQAVDIKL